MARQPPPQSGWGVWGKMADVCLWCQEPLDSSRDGRSPSGIASEVCRACLDNLDFQMGVDLRRYLDSVRAPVVAVSADVVVLVANEAARAMLGKGLPEIEGRLGGEVFECAYARQPGGCGGTIHCSGCALRSSVVHTWTTGQALVGVPACLRKETSAAAQPIQFQISTEKAGGIVLIRIDDRVEQDDGAS